MNRKKVIIVNELDEQINLKYFAEIDFNKEIYRGSRLWLEDKLGNVLLQRCSLKVTFNRNKLAFAVGGTNDEGDTYESCMVREIEEEIGLTDLKIKFICKNFESNNFRKIFCCYFKVIVEDEDINKIKISDETDSIIWLTKDEILRMAENKDNDLSPELLNLDLIKLFI